MVVTFEKATPDLYNRFMERSHVMEIQDDPDFGIEFNVYWVRAILDGKTHGTKFFAVENDGKEEYFTVDTAEYHHLYVH